MTQIRVHSRAFAAVSLAAMAGLLASCARSTPPATKEIESHRAQDLVIALQSESGELARGQNRFVVAFRSAANNQPVDVGTVTVGSSMAMPGMAPMVAAIELQPTGETGKYALKGDFAMSGAWEFEVRWDGPAGRGSTSFRTNVR
jgi:hypothetical protein